MIINGRKAIVIFGAVALACILFLIFISLFVINQLVKDKNKEKMAAAIANRWPKKPEVNPYQVNGSDLKQEQPGDQDQEQPKENDTEIT